MIPKKIHFIYGLSENFGGKPFSFAHWAAVQSTINTNPGYEICIWFQYRPDTFYFEDLVSKVTLCEINAPCEIFGIEIPHVAHRTDLLRIQILEQHGGIYLDLDFIVRRSFDDLLCHRAVMAKEMVDGRPVGVCNAFIMSEAGHPFLQAWRERFRKFRSRGRDEFWNESAVVWPGQLCDSGDFDIHVLPPSSFFVPDWSPSGLDAMFLQEREFPEAYGHHLWESFSWHALSRYNERNFSRLGSTYSKLLEEIVGPDVPRLAETRAEICHKQAKRGGVKLNIGCGTKFMADWINTDAVAVTGADLVFDCEKDEWPLGDHSCREVLVSHVLEHLGDGVEFFFRELYRVCADGASVTIRVPHPRHDWFWQDPTHRKGWVVESFQHLDRQICRQWFFNGDTKTPLALYWGLDFEMVTAKLTVPDEGVSRRLGHAFALRTENLGDVVPFVTNVVGEIAVQLRARKAIHS